MQGATRSVVAVGLALGMLGLGGLGLLKGGVPPPPPPSRGATASFLTPSAGGDLDRTIASLQARLRRGRPRDGRSHAQLGLAYLQKGRLTADPAYLPKAEGLLRGALRLDGRENADALLGMGVLALARHEFAAALAWGRRAREADPFDAHARGLIGDALLDLGRYEEAIRAYQRMIDLRPGLASYARVAHARELHGDVPGAIDAMTEALEAAAGTREDAAWAAFRLGELYLGAGRVNRAEDAYRRGLHLDPKSVLPRVGLAKVTAATGRLDRAARMLAAVTDRYPAPELVILLGDLYEAAGRPADARRQYDLVRAMQELHRASGVNTDLEMALFDADHGVDVDAAVHRARSEYRRRPSVQAADALAWVLYAAGRYREAERYSRDALRLGTPSALFRFHAGMIALRLGHRSEARRHLSEALSIDPNFSFRHRGLAERALARLTGAVR